MTRLPLILAFFVLAATGCEPPWDKEKENLKKACPAPPAQMQTDPALPGGFPDVPGMKYVSAEKNGPTTVVSGFMDETLDPAHQAFSQAVSGASGLAVTKEEQDAADAEVNFSGNGRSGQVKMVQACKARTNVTITIRPA